MDALRWASLGLMATLSLSALACEPQRVSAFVNVSDAQAVVRNEPAGTVARGTFTIDVGVVDNLNEHEAFLHELSLDFPGTPVLTFDPPAPSWPVGRFAVGTSTMRWESTDLPVVDVCDDIGLRGSVIVGALGLQQSFYVASPTPCGEHFTTRCTSIVDLGRGGQPSEATWIHRSPSFNDGDPAPQLEAGIDGELIVLGQTSTRLPFGAPASPGENMYLAKLDARGTLQWSTVLLEANESGNINGGATVAVDENGNIIVAGRLDHDPTPWATLLKLDPSGQELWRHRYAGTDADRVALTASGDGTITMATRCIALSCDLGAGPLEGELSEPALLQVAADGTTRWAQRFSGDGQQFAAYRVTAFGDGGVVLAANIEADGEVATTFDLGGGTRQQSGVSDILLARFDGAGDHLWSYRFGASGVHQLEDLVVSQGRIGLVGGFAGEIDFGGGALATQDKPSAESPAAANDRPQTAFFVELDETGAFAHQWSAGGFGHSFVSNVVAQDGGWTLIGTFDGRLRTDNIDLESGGNSDVFVIDLDANGDTTTASRTGQGCAESVVAAAPLAQGELALLLQNVGHIDFGVGAPPGDSLSEGALVAFRPLPGR